MGAWRAIRHRLEEGLPAEVELRYVGRPWQASPSERYATAHLLEQDRIARSAWARRRHQGSSSSTWTAAPRDGVPLAFTAKGA
jgi:hypothetical protein